jgi:SAM-dependent methyltransferase
MPHRWDNAANIRREQIESGNDITFNQIFVPYYLECVKTHKPKTLLEVGCGTGHLASRLAIEVPQVEALEPSPGMHKVAKVVLANSSVKLHFTTAEKFDGSQMFDMVISHLCGQAVADIETFLRACSKCLENDGLLVFSLPHPCFWNDYREYFPKTEYRYLNEQFAYAKITISKDARSIENVPFHHRPLGRYVEALDKIRMALVRLDEIMPSKSVQALYGKEDHCPFPRFCVLHSIKNPKYLQRVRP